MTNRYYIEFVESYMNYKKSYVIRETETNRWIKSFCNEEKAVKYLNELNK